MSNIELPNGWEPREYQLPLWQDLERGRKRAIALWHRRCGKDSLSLNWAAVAAHQRKGVYWHMLPEAKQARKVVWDGIDRSGRRMIDQAFPAPLRSRVNDQEMKIELKCGSIWQCVGSDNYDSLVGANPVGVVFSEFAIANPASWDFIRPILMENGGWALFIYTPRGKNHGYDLYNMGRRNKDWAVSTLTVDDTWGRGGTVSPADVDAERAAGMPEELIQQEYYCSFTAPNSGAVYGVQMDCLDSMGRMKEVPYEPTLPVVTAWDAGVGDSTAIWFCQRVGGEVRLIDFHENTGKGLDYYAKVVKEKPYSYDEHMVPHDMNVREMSTGRRRLDFLKSLNIGRIRVLPKLPISDGLAAVRALLPKCWFDLDKTERGVHCLKSYHFRLDEKKKTFSNEPEHDWSSNAADAFRYLAVGLKTPKEDAAVRQKFAAMDYDIFG